MTTCCEVHHETPRLPLAALVSHLLRAACLGLIARWTALRAHRRRRRAARQSSDALRWLDDHELREIGITRPIWWMFDHQRQGFGAQPREPEKWRAP